MSQYDHYLGNTFNGEWKLDARFSKNDLIGRIQAIANHRTQIHIDNKDAMIYIQDLKKKLKKAVLFYFDPPYFEKGSDLYDNFYEKEDHAKVSDCIKELLFPWVVSYDNHPVIRTLYPERTAITYSLHYTAQDKKRGSEFMVFSESLSLPPFSVAAKRHFSLEHLS